MIGFLIFFCIQFSESKVIQNITFTSEILQQEVFYNIILPDEYEISNELFPILYLLHGSHDTGFQYITDGNIDEIYDTLVKEKTIRPYVIVMPMAWNSFYIDNYQGTFKYETYFHEELMPKIQAEYNVRNDRIGIAGLSMGGYGAMYYTFKYPDKFCAVESMSGALFSEDYFDKMNVTELDDSEKMVYYLFGTSEYYKERCPSHYLRINKKGTYTHPMRIVEGANDFLYYDNHLFHEELRQKDLYHSFVIRKGEHTWEFWREELPHLLKFFYEVFYAELL